MKKALIFAAAAMVALASCNKNPDDKGINIFSIEDDKELGASFHTEISGNPTEYPILDRTQYAASYAYLEGIRDKILNSGQVFYKDDFEWNVYIIQDDATLNAFVTPGGYIYVYTGLMKYLETEHALAGVMGHEIAHADRRHTTDQLTTAYGVNLVASALLGNASEREATIAEMAAGIALLAYGRGKESEADEYSVNYLCPTDYAADGAAEFFIRLEEEGSASGPEFLSTHPNPGNRVEDIQAKASELNCSGTGTFDEAYADFLTTLP